MADTTNPATASENPTAEFKRRCNEIEESYEFMLAYAAQGLSGSGGQQDGQIREFLNRSAVALTGLADVYEILINRSRLEPVDRYRAFLNVLDRDARDALAAVELVLAQPAISSQLVDNLNASIHLRALLTDLFLIDEVLNGQRFAAKPSNIETPK